MTHCAISHRTTVCGAYYNGLYCVSGDTNWRVVTDAQNGNHAKFTSPAHAEAAAGHALCALLNRECIIDHHQPFGQTFNPSTHKPKPAPLNQWCVTCDGATLSEHATEGEAFNALITTHCPPGSTIKHAMKELGYAIERH